MKRGPHRLNLGLRPRGFSLVEVLVAAALFSILLLALLAMSDGTTSLTNLAKRNIDASSKLRAASDRLATDIENAITEPGMTIHLVKGPDNHELHFLSHVDGYNGERPLAVVRYRVTALPNHQGKGKTVYLLERGAEGVTMNEPSAKDPNPGSAQRPYDTLAEGLFRFVVELIGKDGLPIPLPASGGEVPWSRVGAVAVSMAAIDDRATGIVDPSMNWPAQLPGTDFGIWEQRVIELNFPDLPPEAARGIHLRRKILALPGA